MRPKKKPRFRREHTGTVLSIDHSSLHDMDFFQRFSSEFVTELTVYLDTILLKEDMQVFTEGEPKVDVLFIIRRGTIVLTSEDRVVMTLRDGQIFGLLGCLGILKRRVCTATTQTLCDIRFIPRSLLRRAMSLYPSDKGILEDEALRRISMIEEALRQDEFCIAPEPPPSGKAKGPQSESSDDARRRKTKQLRSQPVSRRGSLGESTPSVNLAVQPSLRALGITQAASRPLSTSSPADGRDLGRGLDLPKMQRRTSAADTTSGVSRRSSLGGLSIPGRRGSSASLQSQRTGGNSATVGRVRPLRIPYPTLARTH
jgi:CRP-like cAMP-binding protein